MRIAQVAPLHESVPPPGYGGTERIVSYLTEKLVEQGHEVTLFATGDSVTRARLIAVVERALRLAGIRDGLAPHCLQVEEVYQRQQDFDVIHYHIDHLHFSLARRMQTPSVTTLHGRLDLPSLPPLYQEFVDLPLVSISDSQRGPLPFANWIGTVRHGLPADLYRFEPRPGDYLAFLGRFSPEKGPQHAIEIARRAGLPLRIGAKVDATDREWFECEIAPELALPGIEYLGEVGGEAKQALLAGARALLFPIEWPEPFGLVMIEALACGTPVIAYPAGSVPEILEDGRTGYLVENVEQAVRRAGELDRLSREQCRRSFEQRFTDGRMARDYLSLYERLRSHRIPGRCADASDRGSVLHPDRLPAA